MGKIGEASLSGWARLLFAAATWSMANAAFGWIYPEHRDIAVLAVQGLDAERRAAFDRLWQEARAGDEQRLCARVPTPRRGSRRRASTGRRSRDWGRSFVLERRTCSRRFAIGLDPRRCGCRRPAQGGSRADSGDRAAGPGRAHARRHCRRPTTPRRRGESRPARERAALRRHAAAARGPAVCEAGGHEPRPFPAAAPRHQSRSARVCESWR